MSDILRTETGFITACECNGEFHTYGTPQPTPATVVELHDRHNPFVSVVTTTPTHRWICGICGTNNPASNYRCWHCNDRDRTR